MLQIFDRAKQLKWNSGLIEGSKNRDRWQRNMWGDSRDKSECKRICGRDNSDVPLVALGLPIG